MLPKPSKEFHIREMDTADKAVIVNLARSLTQFFPQDVVELISESLNNRPVLVGELGEVFLQKFARLLVAVGAEAPVAHEGAIAGVRG